MFQAAKSWISKLKATRLIISEKLELKAETLTATAEDTVSVSTPLTILDTTLGAMASLVLADGYQGQVKIVLMMTDGGDATLTPDNYANGTTLVFDSYDYWIGIFYGSNWHDLGKTAT